MIPTMGLEDKAASPSATREVSSGRPFAVLALWWRWVWSTFAICALAWTATAIWLASVPIFGFLTAGLPFFLMSLWMGSAQRGVLRRYFPLSEAADRPAPFKGWMPVTAIGFLAAFILPYVLFDAVVPRVDPAEVTVRVLLMGAAVGAVIGAAQGSVLCSRWRPAWPFWVLVNTPAVSLAALVWWLVFAVVRAGGPPTPRGWLGPVFFPSDILSLIVGGAAGSLVFATITATGLVWLGVQIARADVGRHLSMVAGLTVLVFLAVLGLSMPTSGNATRTVTTALNPYRIDPTPTIAPTMLGAKTQQVTSGICGTWHYTSFPVGLPDGYRPSTSVGAVSDTEAWASYGSSVLRWMDDEWDLMELPGLGHNAMVYSVEAKSADDVWAAGIMSDPSGVDRTGAWSAHWDGREWSNVAVPEVRTWLRSLAGTGPADVWAVGGDGNAGQHLISIFHWNGKAWAAVPNPDTISQGMLSDVAAVSPNDAWAVGYSEGTSSGPVTIHWDGKEWGLVPDAVGGARIAVAATSPDDVWVAGQNPPLSHWDGKEWKPVSAEQLGLDLSEEVVLSAVAASSPSDVWAVGAEGYRPLLLHWDGGSWSITPSPDVQGNWSDVAVAKRTVWAVGTNSGVPGRPQLPFLGRFVMEDCPGTSP